MKFRCVWVLSSMVGFAVSLLGAEAVPSGNTVKLSNDRISAVIDLAQGARLASFADRKRGVEWTKIMKSPGGSGLFGDSLHDPVSHKVDNSYQSKTYKLIAAQSGKTATVATCSPAGQTLDIGKTFVLADGSDKIEVHYVITNPGTQDVVSSFRGANAFQIAGEKEYILHFPDGRRGGSRWLPEGPEQPNRIVYDTGAGKSADIFVFEPDRSYVSVGTSKGDAVLEVPFPYLGYFYTWQNSASTGFAIADWFTTAFQLPPLSKGKAEAELHAVQKDPLAKYKYQFTVSLRLPEKFSYETYGKINPAPKSGAFAPRTGEDRSYRDFSMPAIIRNPAPAKKWKVLAFSCAAANAEMNELQRRLNLDLTLIETSNLTAFRSTPYFGWQIPQPAEYLKKALKQDYDVILVCGHSEQNIPKELLAALRKKVEAGTAFIYVGEKNLFPSIVPPKKGAKVPAAVYEGTLADRLPAFGSVTESSLGKGRVLFLNFTMTLQQKQWIQESRAVVPHVSKEPQDFPYWEYYFAFYGKLCRYAANAKQLAEILSAAAEPGKLRLCLSAGQPLEAAQISASCDTPLGRSAGKILWKGNLKQGNNELLLPLEPVGTDGEYIVHLQLSASGNTLDWFDAAYCYRSPDRIEKLQCAYPAVSVQIAGKGDLELRLVESATGRSAALWKKQAASGKIDCKLKRAFRSHLKHYELRAELRGADGRILSLVKKSVLIRPDRSNPEKIRPLIWGAHIQSWRDRGFNAEMADCGFVNYKAPIANVKTDEEFRNEADAVARSGMEYMPLGIEQIKGSSAPGTPTVRTQCLRSPKFQERLADRSRLIGKRARETMSDGVFINDEMTLSHYWNAPHDYCTSLWCRAAFREMLKKKYSSDLEKLNRNWKTSFDSWDKVVPDTMLAARKKKNFASWIEHRLFMMDAMTGAFRLIHCVIRESCGAKLGVSGMDMTKVYQGYDLMATAPYLTCSSNYIKPSPFTADALRSCMTKEHCTGAYTDYGTRFAVWTQIIDGLLMPSVWWYGHLMRRGDARLSGEGLHLKKMFADIRNSGASCILGYGSRRKSPVTLISSTRSLIASEAAAQSGGISGVGYTENLNSWSRLIRDMGLDAPDVLSEEKITELAPEKNPVVLLPLALMLSDAEIAALAKYVAAGGFLIADLDPGKYDEFGVLRREKGLYPLLGVKTAPGMAIGSAGKLKIGGFSPGNVFFGGPLTLAEDAKAQGGIGLGIKGADFGGIRLLPVFQVKAPAAVVRKVGKGHTLYLNFAMPEYAQSESPRKDRRNQMVSALRPLLNIPGTIQTLPENSTWAACELDGIPYLFLARGEGESDGKYELFFPAKSHLYEMISGQYAGHAASVRGTVAERSVKLYGAFPEKLSPLAGEVTFDGRFFRIRAERKTRCSSLVRLQVFRDGKELLPLCETLRMKETLEKNVDIGLAPLPGTWKIVLTSIADGSRIEKTLTIPLH